MYGGRFLGGFAIDRKLELMEARIFGPILRGKRVFMAGASHRRRRLSTRLRRGRQKIHPLPPNRPQHQVSSTNQHPIGMVTT